MEDGLQAEYLTRRFDDADELAHTFRAASVDYLPLQSGPYESRLTVMRLGTLTLQHASDGAHLSRGTTSAGVSSLIFGTTPHEETLANGVRAAGDMACLYASSAELHMYCERPVQWGGVTLPAEELAAMANVWHEDLPDHGCKIFHLAPGAANRLRKAVTAAASLVETLDHVLEHPHFGTALAAGLRDVIASTAAATDEVPSTSWRMTGEMLRIMRQADAFLRENSARPIYSDELCKVTGVSQRKLHLTFTRACGMSPQIYLKRRRLMIVRRILRAAPPDQTLIKSVALSHGFWHLGNFAADYRHLFGEAPSVTLARSQDRGHA
jgi:AraC family ethanolamine operon transcriptional activator